MTLTYFFMATGGVGATPDGTVPPNAVPCTQAQYANPTQYEINYATSPPSIQAVAHATSLQIAQSNRIMALQTACQNAIFSGYQSRALGSPFLYPAKTTDQMNMLSSLVAALGSVLFEADDWPPDTEVVEQQLVWYQKQLYVVTQNGTTSSQMPQWPLSADVNVLDGTAKWQLWSTPFWCADLSQSPPVWAWRDHTLRQIWQVGKDAKISILEDMGMNAFLAQQVLAAVDVATVNAVNWPSSFIG